MLSFDALQFSVRSGHAYFSSFHSYTNRIDLLFETYSSQLAFSFCLQMNKNVISSPYCADCFPLIWLFHWELTCETLSGMYVKIKSEKVDIISHPFHIYFTTQNFTSMWNMHVKMPVKSMWKTCENRPFITLFSHDFHRYTPGSGWT